MRNSKSELPELVNPLDKFQSYNVHYVMTVARTTKSLEGILNENSTRPEFLSAINNTKNLGDTVVAPGVPPGEMFLILDTRRFTQFSVENLKYEVLVNGIQSGGSVSNLATDLEMTVIDSVGISFSNFLQWIIDTQVRTSYDGLVWLLQVIFVGENSNTQNQIGSSATHETVMTASIPMILQQINVDLNYAKGIYSMKFMPILNFNTSRNAKFLRVPHDTGTVIPNTGTLGAMVTAFETALTNASEKYYNELNNHVPGTGQSKKKFGRRVKYFITIPPDWQNFMLNTVSVNSESETDFSKDGKTRKVDSTEKIPTHTPAPASQSITAVLDTMFSTVKEISELGNFKKVEEGSELTFYKHIVGVSSDNEAFYVHVNVVKFTVPTVRPLSESKKVEVSSSDLYNIRRDPSTGIEYSFPKKFYAFDYIFTGKNTQVLNFDVKIQDFQFLLASNLKFGPAVLNSISDSNGDVIDSRIAEQMREVANLREYDPILPPLISAQQHSGFSTLAKSLSDEEAKSIQSNQQQYTRNLSMFYAGSPISANLVIKGNPDIMQGFVIGKVMPVPKVEDYSNAGREQYHRNLISRILEVTGGREETTGTNRGSIVVSKIKSQQSYATTPAFVHVNVRGPRVDFRTNEPLSDSESGSGDYATSVLSENYYVIFKLVNKIEGSVFTQEMDLYSHNIYGAYKMDKSGRPQPLK